MAEGARNGMAVLAVVAFAPLGCGPSFQAIYEGDQRFEHCYALDDNPVASLDDKGKCWRDWMQNSTYGQTRDRVEYAAVRQRALSRLAIPTDEAMMQAAPGQVVSRSVATPAPTSAFAPPPKTMGDADPHAPGPAAAALPQEAQGRVVFVAPAPAANGMNAAAAPPSADCQDGCTHTWQACGGKSDKPDPACAKAYKTCMRGCFK
jgi:hypothetical protein